MTHPLVEQLFFTRGEFMRAIEGVSDEDARIRILPMNCIAWNVGHLAWHEQRHFLSQAQNILPFPEINRDFAYGAAGSTPDLSEMLNKWKAITQAADPWLESLNNAKLAEHVMNDGKPTQKIWGNVLQRVIYHYWYHLGENAGIRQALGHTDLPQFVGDIDHLAPWREAE